VGGEQPRIDHVCLGLDEFDADIVKRKLDAEGLEATIRLRGDTKELYFTDANGIQIQLQDVRYRGAVGPLGARERSRVSRTMSKRPSGPTSNPSRRRRRGNPVAELVPSASSVCSEASASSKAGAGRLLRR